MKKIKIIIFFLFIFLFTPKVFASTNQFERTEENNYGINKKWKIDQKNIGFALDTPFVDASEKIYDFSDIFTEEEEKKLLEEITTYINKYQMDIVVLTYNLPYTNDTENENFATDFYDFNDFGIDFSSYSGVLLFRNTYNIDPYYDMYSFGEAQLYYDSDRMSNILDTLYNNIHNANYMNAMEQWFSELTFYHNMGKIEGYYVDENSYLRKNFNPYIGVNLLITLILTSIFVVTNVKKNKMVMLATDASTYLNKSTFKLLEERDTLVNSVTTSWTESDHTHSSGGGGIHSSSGHSGGGHSSGGGRHG